jgi:hypothetical protein
MNFPATPANGAIYSPFGGPVYVFNSPVWDIFQAGWSAGQPPSMSLYYTATAAQTAFLVTTADRFGNSFTIVVDSSVQVSRSGARLMPADNYTVTGNTVTLLSPCGEGEPVIIDIWEPV